MATLLEISHELLHLIITGIDPADLAALSQTCRTLLSYIRANRLLHKDIYIQHYDGPPASMEPDWEEEVHKAVKLEKIFESSDREVKREHIGFATEQIQSLLKTAQPWEDPSDSRNIELLTHYFQDTDNMDTLLCSSSLFERGGTGFQEPALTPELRQASARLHCLYGRPIEPVPSKRCSAHYAISPFFQIRQIDTQSLPSENTRGQTRGTPAHTVARSRVYDLRNYTDASLWGPFKDDGSQNVDWEKVEAVMLVLGFNLNKFSDRSGGRFPRLWDVAWEGASPNSYISDPPLEGPTKALDDEISMFRDLSPSLDSLDPYGVTGTWMRIVCFLDYNDLYAFNFSSRPPEGADREPIDTEEGIIDLAEHVCTFHAAEFLLTWCLCGLAIRLIRIKLQVTRIEPPGSADEDEEEDGMDWSDFKGERLPIVHFRGSSRSLHASWDPNANSRIRGTVRQTPEGEIRWTTFSIFHGEERWRSEGIQVGGIRSARGVLGNWFDKDYDMHGPAGPTAFWKESDELVEEKTSSTPLAYF